MATKPITPKEVVSLKKTLIPDVVIESFNELIAENYSNGHSEFLTKKVVARMVSKGLKEKDIYNNGWLDVEDIYSIAGWEVNYDNPAYNEDYYPSYSFSKK